VWITDQNTGLTIEGTLNIGEKCSTGEKTAGKANTAERESIAGKGGTEREMSPDMAEWSQVWLARIRCLPTRQ